MKNEFINFFAIASILLLTGCDDRLDYVGYYSIPDYHYAFFSSFPDTLMFQSSDSTLYSFVNIARDTTTARGSYEYIEHTVYWDYDIYKTLYQCGNLQMEYQVYFFGNPYEGSYWVEYSFDFQYPEDVDYHFTYSFDNPDTLLFVNDSTIEWATYGHSGLMTFKRTEGILSFGGIRMRERLYRTSI